MRKTSWAAAALLLGTLLFLGLGCSKSKSTPTGPGQGGVAAVQLVMSADTVDFLPGDSAAVLGTIVVKDNAGQGKPGVKVNIALSESWGYITFVDASLRDTSNAQGIVLFYFNTRDQSGRNVITASVGDLADSKPIVVRTAPNRIARLTLNVDRQLLEVAENQEDSVNVTVTLADSNFQGIPNFHVSVTANGGRLKPILNTDSTGRARTVWYSGSQYSQGPNDFYIFAHAGLLKDSTRVEVRQLPSFGTLRVSTDTRRIRADHCNTMATLVAVLQDSRGTAISGDTIHFSTPRIGTATSYAVTDSMGRARATFCDMDAPSTGPEDSAVIIVRYARWSLVDSLHIYVAPVSQVANVTLTAPSLQGTAGVDSTILSVRAFYDDGLPVTGSLVLFDRICGRFTNDTVTISHGSASNYWHFCDQTNVRALVWCTVDNVTSDTLEFQVDPGPERRIRLVRDSSAIHIASIVRIRAEVRDSLRNMVRSNVPVTFTSTIGTITPTSPVPTADDGYATAFLNSGTTGGPCVVKGTISSGTIVDSTVITIISGLAASLQLRVSNPSPQVHGAGGQDWSQVYADVRDANGNNVPNGQWVTFSIIGDPGGGCNINGHGSVDSAQTANGTAVVTFSAGTNPGPVNIQAVAQVEGRVISGQASIINITAGPPNSITIAPGNTGVDAGGAAWDLTITAIVNDLYNNRVRDSIAVFFDVQPGVAQVLSDTAYTGNGQHRSGVAYTTMRYLSPATNNVVQISARTADPGAVSTSISYKLPPQNPTITVYCTPSNWHFPTMGDPCHINCRCLVVDGHLIPINGCRVIYSAARGRMYPTDPNGNTPQSYQFTGPLPLGNAFETEDGHATLWLRDLATNIFPDPAQAELNGDVTVEVEGFSGAQDSQIINFRRGQGF